VGFGLTATPALASSDPAPAGANDWSCKPTAAHPEPLVLVHGLGATMAANWSYLSPKLKAAGYCVFALTYGVDPRSEIFPYAPGGVIPMEQSAPQLAAFVDRVLAATGAGKVDLVGHSEGTVMPRYYLKNLGGAAKVDKFVAMTPLWRGTDLAGAAELRDNGASLGLSQLFIGLVASFCGSCPEFITGSPFLNAINSGGEAVSGVTYTSLVTRYDELVSPYTSGIMNATGATNIVVQDVCPTDVSEHGSMAFDPVVGQLILNALDPPHATPVVCGTLPPLIP
jgi:triacylglycerol esterase/lipase EstA (alpha/beta hydrolase family)